MPSGNTKRVLVLLPLAAFLAVLPLIVHGSSCGQDQVFHLQSWFDAAQQLRHGHYPHWAFTAAWNAGEPRFQFYPPLSWLIGAMLTMIFPANAAPLVYIFLALTASGFAMYFLSRNFVDTQAALLASAFYLANPYMLFNAFERSALAELLAAAWIPLLLLGILRARPTVRGIAIPLALLWLTNAPAAVMGSYTLAILAALRVISAITRKLSSRPTRGNGEIPVFRLTLTFLSGTILGLALPAFYLIPAAVERKYVQVAMAIIPNMRYQDNFLFARTADAAHNTVNHTASTLALAILALTVLTISALYLSLKPVISSEAKRSGETPVSRLGLTTTLALLTLLITFLLVPLSTPIWAHLPELAFLQFPWRLLTILSAVLAFALALLLGAPFMTQLHRGMSGVTTACISLVLPLTLSLIGYHLYAQACDPHDIPANIASLIATHHGLGPTDEYTPNAADNDVLRTNNPGYWLATHPNDPAPNTTPTPSELHPDITTDDSPIPVEQTLSTPAPHHFNFHANSRGYLVLNLRDYPNWDITESDPNSMERYHPAHNIRDDGLVALSLYYPSDYTIDVTWHRTWDRNLGVAITLLALLDLLAGTLTARHKSRCVQLA